MPSVIAAITPIPDESPSSPSMKLMLLTTPMIQMTVKAADQTPSSGDLPRPERVVHRAHLDPGQHHDDRPRAIWPRNCQRARRS